MLAVHVKEAHAGSAAIFLERLKLQARVGVDDGQRAIFGGDGVVHDGEGEIGAADFASLGPRAGKGLRGRALRGAGAGTLDERGVAGCSGAAAAVPSFLV